MANQLNFNDTKRQYLYMSPCINPSVDNAVVKLKQKQETENTTTTKYE